MSKLIKITGLTKEGGEYPLLVNEADIVKVDQNRKDNERWKAVVEMRGGKSHFVKETLDTIYKQLGHE